MSQRIFLLRFDVKYKKGVVCYNCVFRRKNAWLCMEHNVSCLDLVNNSCSKFKRRE